MKPLVSILIPAYNSQEWIADTLQSAIAQTWKRKEIIVVDDGSTDRTADVAGRFASQSVKVVSTRNQGSCAARNRAFQLSQGDYIQWLDHDDLLAPDKVEHQLAALRPRDSKRVLLSSPWAYFYYRTGRARFIPTRLWQDLSPVEWLLRKMGENLFVQTGTWLVSRELAEAAGPWNTNVLVDDDGEYFCRVLMASEGTRFVPQAKAFWRIISSTQLHHIGTSDRKKDNLILSMKLSIRYLQSLEQSERVRKACLTYLQNWYGNFYPERPDLMAQLQGMAAGLGGHLEPPCLTWKYACMEPLVGRKTAKRAQRVLSGLKSSCIRHWDRAMFRFESRRRALETRDSGFGIRGEEASCTPPR